MEQRSLRALEFNGQLSGDELFAFLQLGMLLVAETVLQFDLEVVGESWAGGRRQIPDQRRCGLPRAERARSAPASLIAPR